MLNKGNDGKGNIPERDLWETKQELWDTLNNQYKFTFDCCANQNNKKTNKFSWDFETIQEAELCDDVCWMNPPFSLALDMFKHFFKVIKKGVAIYRCDNIETKVWQDIILKYADWVFIPKGRVSYTPFGTGNMHNGMGTRFPSALIGIGIEPPINLIGKNLIVFTYTKREMELLKFVKSKNRLNKPKVKSLLPLAEQQEKMQFTRSMSINTLYKMKRM
jgi:hypothetical protein